MRLGIAAALLAPAVACAQAADAPTAPAAPAAPAAAPAAATAPPAAEPSAALGRRAYTSYCARCHGLNLIVSSSAFYDLRTFPKHDKERFTRSVLKGSRAMPAWEGTIKPEELESIWLYVGSVNGW
ncbi:MAG: c-type cytochrome [Rubrivivax sp.]